MTGILRLLETGRVSPTGMTTHRFPFSRVEEAFRLMQTKADGAIKPSTRSDAQWSARNCSFPSPFCNVSSAVFGPINGGSKVSSE